MSAPGRTSAIWQYFQEVREDKKSNWFCVIYKSVGTCKNTSNQWKHLELLSQRGMGRAKMKEAAAKETKAGR